MANGRIRIVRATAFRRTVRGMRGGCRWDRHHNCEVIELPDGVSIYLCTVCDDIEPEKR